MDYVSKCIPEVHCQVARKNQCETMQDRHLVAQIVLPDKGKVDLVAIFDGHGDHHVAEELLKILPEIVANKLDKVANIHSPIAVTHALYQTILAADYKMYQGNGLHGGSTAIIVLWPHDDNYLYIANLGDSRAVVWSDNTIIMETADHRPQLAEVERIHASGGYISNGLVGGVLDISRSFGDYTRDLKLMNNRYMGIGAPVSSEPDVYRIDLSKRPGKVRLILASDGLWNVMSSQQVVQFFGVADNKEQCASIISEAIKRGSQDNITVMLIDIPQCLRNKTDL